MKVNKVLKVIAIGMAFLLTVSAVAFSIYIGTINYPQLDTALLDSISKTVTIYDINGNSVKNDGLKYGTKIKYEDLPQHLINAFISIEDKRFFKHNGIDYLRIASAMLDNIASMSAKEGASTISQQLIKNTHLTKEKTIERKLKEMHLARQLEKKYTKEQILEMYLNCIYFGNDAYGIESAAKKYFSKSASDLTLEEAALLAGIINSPSKYNPLKYIEQAKKRRNLVLRQMNRNGYITDAEYKSATDLPIKLSPNNLFYTGKYIDAAVDEALELVSHLGVKNLNDCAIHTYLEPQVQRALFDNVSKIEKEFANDYGVPPEFCAVSVDNQTAGVTAFVASPFTSVNTLRQPASTIKPFAVYIPAMEAGLISPATLVLDEPINYSGYTPQNNNGRHLGWISVRQAVKTSNNVVAIKLLDLVGLDSAKACCNQLGIPLSVFDNNLSVALGGIHEGVAMLPLTNAYATIARGGVFIKPSFVKSITDKNGNILYQRQDHGVKVFGEDTAYLMTHMLRDNALSGTASRLKDLNFEVASKTGTNGLKGSNNNMDAYCIAYTSENTLGVWVGAKDNNEQNLLKDTINGSTLPAEIVKRVFQNIYEKETPKDFKVPPSVIKTDIDKTRYKNEHLVVLAGSDIPPAFRQTEVFSVRNMPTQLIEKPKTAENNNKPVPGNDSNQFLKKRKDFIDKLREYFGRGWRKPA